MRKPQDITVDRALLLLLLHLTDSHSMVSDVKVQQLVFLSELQMLSKGLRGFHFEFMRFAYGAFSKELDNDLLALRRKERLENCRLTEQATDVITIIEQNVEDEGEEANVQIMDILRSVIETYAPQDLGEITSSVENVEISPAGKPEEKIAIRDVSFHSILLVPSRIEVSGEFTLPPLTVSSLNTALGY
ncbi:MAG: hypothetical protein GKS05_04120 [Nitrospirales bacterium]|nr:hypothetical protein [Nitrospirales bacterium]